MKSRGMTSPLIRAVLGGNREELSQYLEQGEDVNAADEVGRTPLMHAAIDNRVGLLGDLIEAGADLNVQDSNGYSALHFASQEQHLQIVEMLLACDDIDIDAVDSFGNTPLWRATFSARDHGDVVRLLVKKGADPGKENEHGVSPRSLAQTIANYNVRDFLE